MSMELLIVMFATLTLFIICHVVGRLFFNILKVRDDAFYTCASGVTGLTLLALQLWLFGLVNVPWNVITLLLPWFLLGALSIYRKRLPIRKLFTLPKSHKRIGKAFTELDLLSRSLVILIILFMLSFFIMLAVQPFNTSDILAFWGYKAQEFYVNQAVYVNDFLKSDSRLAQYYHIDYPPLWPLMADVTYTIFGGVNETLFKTTQMIFLVSGAASLLAFIREKITHRYITAAFALVFVLVAAPQFFRMLFEISYMGYADYPLAILMIVSTMFLVRSLKNFPNVDSALAIFFAGAVAVTKNEGIPFFVAVVGLSALIYSLEIFRSKKLPTLNQTLATLFVVGVTSLPFFLWSYFKSVNNIRVDFSYANFLASGMTIYERFYTIFQLIWLYIKTNPPYIWQAAATIIALFATLFIRSKEMLVVATLLTAQLASYVFSYFLSPYDLRFHILSSIDRLSTQVFPLVLLLLGLALQTQSKNIIRERKRKTVQLEKPNS